MYDVDAIEAELLGDLADETEEVIPEGEDLDLQNDDLGNEDQLEDGIENEDEEHFTDELDDEDTEPEDEGQDEPDVDETPQHRAFAEMRVENRNLTEQLSQQDELLEIVRLGSGFESKEQLISALLGAKPEIDKQVMGLDDDGYNKHLQLEEERRAIELEKQTIFEEKLNTRATQFQGAVDKMSTELGIEADVVFRNLAENGYTDMEDVLMGTQDYNRLLKSVLLDEIVEHEANKRADRELSRKSVETGKIKNTRSASSTFEEQQDSLLDKELEEFKSSQGY